MKTLALALTLIASVTATSFMLSFMAFDNFSGILLTDGDSVSENQKIRLTSGNIGNSPLGPNQFFEIHVEAKYDVMDIFGNILASQTVKYPEVLQSATWLHQVVEVKIPSGLDPHIEPGYRVRVTFKNWTLLMETLADGSFLIHDMQEDEHWFMVR